MKRIRVERNIVNPWDRTPRGRILAAMRACEVGDSFVIPKTMRPWITIAGRTFPDLEGRKYKRVVISETEARVWRVA